MMRQLFLIRHAQAESPSAATKDLDRELTSSGYIEAYRMSRWLHDSGAKPDLIIASIARRTMATAQVFAEQLGYPVDSIVFRDGLYDASLRNLFGAISSIPDTCAQVCIVAHNPTLSYLAEYLTSEEIGTIPTCGVVKIEFEDQTWAEVSGKSGKLAWFEFSANGGGA
jgi:phosphohistidine phosphatase